MHHFTGIVSLAIASSAPLLIALPSFAQRVVNPQDAQTHQNPSALESTLIVSEEQQTDRPNSPAAENAQASQNDLTVPEQDSQETQDNQETLEVPESQDSETIPDTPEVPGASDSEETLDRQEFQDSQETPTRPPIQITQVQLIPIEDGLQVVLVAADPTAPEIFQFQENNTLFVDIVGAELALPEGDRFQRDNPVPSVASISMDQVSDSEVQIAVIAATDIAPNAYLERAAESLILDIATTPPGESTDAEDLQFGNNLRIIVAAEPLPRYQVPAASVGTRTDTDILDIPQGIQVIPQEVLEDQGTTSLGDALQNASGVTSGRTAGASRATTPIIRGFETDNILRNGLRDDTLRLGSGVTNIERIEVLKGPASVLFGSGNLGGTVNLVTEVPLSDPLYDVEATMGNFARYGTALDFTGPLTDSTGYRANLAYENRGSFVDFENSEFFFFAPTLQVIDTGQTSLIVDFEYLYNRSEGTSVGLPAVSAIGLNDNALVDNFLSGGGSFSEEDIARAGTLDIRTNSGEPDISRTETNISRISYRLDHQINETWQIRNEFLASFQNTAEDSFVAGVNFSQITGQVDFNLLDRIYLDNPSNREAYTFNTNVVGDFQIAGIDQTLLLGVEWFQETQEDLLFFRQFLPFLDPEVERFNVFEPNYDPRRFFPENNPDFALSRRSDSFTRRRTIGLYGQSQLNLSDSLIVLVGGRIDFADQFFVDAVTNPQPIETSDVAFSPRVGIVYKPAENVSLYASYTESFNPVIGRSEAGEIFEPERGRQFEVGLKADISDRLSATLAYYQLRRTNVSTQDPANQGFQVQVGEQASDGVELDIAGELAPGWNIIASYAYTDARVLEDNEFPEGLQLTNVPKHSASLWTSYEIQDGDLEGLGFGLGVYFQDDRNGDLRRPFTLPSYVRTDASIFYRRENFRAQLNFQNLFDVRYFEGARDQFRVIPGAPFTIFGSVGWEF
ncbi:TonB-dependent siderophore receptor [Oscillatoria sp. CS-180]|uniref:TonB-dependent siderophore receptor n=1 Tax=Oscillatoria sp. CS-180 TaxID=3021720 RepID=UPI00232BB355|nr:TonB-dependent siderophore receptor [Oscillatoria sp. CS-180]MDB9529320.1 TonB-dependent siderophore receptor [Oscillatoria sp. CS-180]